MPDFSHGTRGLGDFLHNRIHEAETRVTRYSQQPAVHEAVATFSPTDRLQKPRPGAGAGAASGGGAAGGIVAELTGDGRFSSGHQLNAGAPAFHPRQHQTPQQTFEFEGVANPDDDDWVKNPDIRSYWTAPDAKQGSSVRQVPVPTASSGRYAGIAAELTSDGRLDPEPWQGNYPASVPVGKGFPKPGTPGNDWRREWRGEEPSRLKSAEEHWNPRSLNGSSKGKGKGKKGGKDAVGPEWYGWSKGTHEDRDRRGPEDRRPRQAEVRQRGEKGGMNRQHRQEDRQGQDKRDGRAGRRQNDRSRNMHEGKKDLEEAPGRTRRQRRRERKAGPPDGQAQTEADEKEPSTKQSTTPGNAARDSESPERDGGGPSSVGSRIEGSRAEDSDSKLS